MILHCIIKVQKWHFFFNIWQFFTSEEIKEVKKKKKKILKCKNFVHLHIFFTSYGLNMYNLRLAWALKVLWFGLCWFVVFFGVVCGGLWCFVVFSATFYRTIVPLVFLLRSWPRWKRAGPR